MQLQLMCDTSRARRQRAFSQHQLRRFKGESEGASFSQAAESQDVPRAARKNSGFHIMEFALVTKLDSAYAVHGNPFTPSVGEDAHQVFDVADLALLFECRQGVFVDGDIAGARVDQKLDVTEALNDTLDIEGFSTFFCHWDDVDRLCHNSGGNGSHEKEKYPAEQLIH